LPTNSSTMQGRNRFRAAWPEYILDGGDDHFSPAFNPKVNVTTPRSRHSTRIRHDLIPRRRPPAPRCARRHEQQRTHAVPGQTGRLGPLKNVTKRRPVRFRSSEAGVGKGASADSPVASKRGCRHMHPR
jgi:hypothetical protein